MTAPFNPPLQVDPGHLRELAEKQRDAAHQIGLATPVTDGEADKLATSHGAVCEPTSSAARDAAAARKEACLAMQAMSDTFAENLERAARRYVATDAGAAGAIEEISRSLE